MSFLKGQCLTPSCIARHERGGAFNRKERAVEHFFLVLATLGKVGPNASNQSTGSAAARPHNHKFFVFAFAAAGPNMTATTVTSVTNLKKLLAEKEAEIRKLKKTITLGETQWESNLAIETSDEQRLAVKDYFAHFALKEKEDKYDDDSSVGSDYDEEAASAAYAAQIEQEDQEKMMWMERRGIHAGHLLLVLHEMMEDAAGRLTCCDVRYVHGVNERLKPDTALSFEISRSNDSTATVNCVGGDTIYHLVQLVCESYIHPRWNSFDDSGCAEDHVWYLSSGGGWEGKRKEKDKISAAAMSMPSSLRRQSLNWAFDFDNMAATKEYVGPDGPIIRDPYHENDWHRIFVSPEDSPCLFECFVLRSGSTLTLEYDGGTFTLTRVVNDVIEN